MKEKLLKNLKAKGVHATTRYNELFATNSLLIKPLKTPLTKHYGFLNIFLKTFLKE